jgi:hypothetical protein
MMHFVPMSCVGVVASAIEKFWPAKQPKQQLPSSLVIISLAIEVGFNNA